MDNINIIRTDYRLFRSLLGDDIISFVKILGFNPVKKPDKDYVDFEYDGSQYEFLVDAVSDDVLKLIVAAGRGSGKTYSAGVLNFFLLFHEYQIFNLGGSETQTKKIREYVDDIVSSFDLYHIVDVKGESISIKGTKYKAIYAAASTKQVRSPHFHKDVNGLLILDEVCEIDNGLVKAAFRIGGTNSAKIFKKILLSTRHNLNSVFIDYFDNAKYYGYKRYYWDQFEVSCCNQDCDTCIPEFAKNTYIDKSGRIFFDTEKRDLEWKLVRKAYCGGRAKKCGGPLDINKIKNDFVESSNIEEFEVENLGRVAKVSQFVIRDRTSLNKLLDTGIDLNKFSVYRSYIGIDWGFSGQTAIVVGQVGLYDRKKLIFFVRHYEFHSKTGITVIAKRISSLFKEYKVNTVFADASDPFNNDYLKTNEKLPVVEVPFAKYKDSAVGLFNNLIENQIFYINQNVVNIKTYIDQLKNWKRDNKGKIVKKDDHGPDATLTILSFLTINDFRLVTHKPKIDEMINYNINTVDKLRQLMMKRREQEISRWDGFANSSKLRW